MITTTERKCVLAVAGLHGLLLLILVVGPAFLMRSDKLEDMPVLEFIPDILVDEPVQGGGSPNVTQPPPPRETVKRERQPVTLKADEPKPEVKPEVKIPEPKQEVSKYTPPDQIKISDKPAKRNDTKTTTPKASTPRTDPAKVFADAANSIRSAALSTTIEMPSLGAGSGPAYANYAQAIKSIYEKNWQPPEETSTDDALVKVEVVIARDGSVDSSKIISRCGDAGVDGSVEDTLRRVKALGVPPFPAGVKDSQRTYIIGFNLKAKRGFA